MKKFFLFLTTVLVSVLSAFAQEPEVVFSANFTGGNMPAEGSGWLCYDNNNQLAPGSGRNGTSGMLERNFAPEMSSAFFARECGANENAAHRIEYGNGNGVEWGMPMVAGEYTVTYYAGTWNDNTGNANGTSKVFLQFIDAKTSEVVFSSEHVNIANFENGGACNGQADKVTETFNCNGGNIIIKAWGTHNTVWGGLTIATAAAPAAGWDGETFTTSLDDVTLKSWEDLEGITFKFPGAKSIEVDEEEAYFEICDTWAYGSEVYVVWAPAYGSEYSINGDEITLTGFIDANSLMVKPEMKAKAKKVIRKAAEGETEYQLNMYTYGGIIVDGIPADEIDIFFNCEEPGAAAEPFMLTAISNNDVNGSVAGVEASEAGVSKTFVVTYSEPLSKGEAEATLSMMESDKAFGAATITTTESGAIISFDEAGAASFTKAGTYVLSIPEGVFVDAEGTPNAAIYAKWVVIQGDEPEAGELANADFAEGVVGDVNIATYAKDGTPNQMQEVPGWSFGVANDDARAAGVIAYGSATTLGGATYTVPTAGPEGTNGNALAMVGVWTGTVQYVQDVELPAGKYTMTVPVYNTAGTTAFVKNLIGVKIGETENYATATSYPVGKWTNEVVTFELEEDATVTFSLGYEGANAGSGASQHLFIDRVDVEVYDELAVTKNAALAALPEGNESIFTPSAEDVAAVKAAIEAATTVEEVEAAAATEMAIPALEGEYVVVNTNGDMYLGTSEANVVLSADQVNVTFEKAEGGYYIKAGEVYINMRGDNNWSMSADAEAKTAWNFALSGDNYTISGPKGMIGTDNVEAGSICYGDKNASKNGLWTIEVAPCTDPIDMTDKIINPQFQDALNGWTLDKIATTENGGTPSTGVKGPDSNKVITAFNTTFDCQQTIEGLEAGWYKLSVQAFARPTAQGNTQKIEDNPAAFAEHTNFIYANDAQKRAMLITEDGSITEVSGCLKLNSGLWVPTSSNTTSAIFDKGLYDQSLLFQVAEDGKAVIGVKGEIVADGGSYYAFDNFRLTKVFVADAEDVEALMATVPEGAMDAQVKAAMEAAVEALGKKASIDNFLAAEEAIAAAKASAADYAAVKALMDSEATKAEKLEVSEAYAAAIAEVSAAYENGAIEDIEAAENVVKAAVVQAYCADMEPGKDLTALLNNTTFDNNDMNGWDVIGGLTSKNHVARSFEQNYDASQTIVGLPAGTYKVEIQLFGRGMSNNDMVAALKAGEELPSNQTYFYANDVEVEANQITSETVAEKGAGNWTEMPDGTWIPDNAAATEVVFNAGLYKQELTVEVGEDGILKVGVKMEGDHAGRYSGLDNLKLTYVGQAEPEIAVAIEEGEGTYTVTSTSETAALYYLCKPMSWLDEGETPESCLLSDIEGMGSMVDSEETWEMYGHMGMEPAPKTFTVADYQEMYAGQEMFLIAANVGWNGEKLAVISNIEQINFTVPAAPEAEFEGTPFDISWAGMPTPDDAVRTFNFDGQWQAIEPNIRNFDPAEDKQIVVKFAEPLTVGYNVPFKQADGTQQWNACGGDQTGWGIFEIDVNEVMTEFGIQNTQTSANSLTITESYVVKNDESQVPLVWNPSGWGPKMTISGITSGSATISQQWAGVNMVAPEAFLQDGTKTLRIYTENDMTGMPFQWCLTDVDGNASYPAIGVDETGTYAEFTTDLLIKSLYLQHTTSDPTTLDIKAITWEFTPADKFEIAFDVEDGAEVDPAETMSIHASVTVSGVDAEDDLYVEGMIYGMDGSATPIIAYTDFEDGVDISIAHMNAGNYRIEITKVAYGEVVGMDEETYMPIFENEVVAEEGMSLASLTFSIAGEVEPATIEIAEVQVNGTEMKVIFAEGTDLGDNYTEKPYIMAGEEKIEIKDYFTDNNTGGFFDPLNVIVITLNEELAAGEYTVVVPAGAFIVNGGENNAETSATFTIGDGDGIQGIEIAAKDGKYMQNGKVVIVKNGKTFNAAGTRVK